MKRLFAALALAICVLSRPAAAQDESIVFPVPGNPGIVSAGFYDPTYLREIGVQHLGVDLPADVGAGVVSPVTGTVVLNRTQGVDPLRAYLVIRSTSTGHDHVLAHIVSDLADQSAIAAGAPVGAIVAAGTGPHLHYGINRTGALAAMDNSTGWGFGQAPAASDAAAAMARGWMDPAPLLAAAAGNAGLETGGPAADPGGSDPQPAAEPIGTGPWTKGLIAGVKVGFMPCGTARQTPDCLRALGFSDEAIDFSFGIDRDYSGATVGIDFADVGAVDLALAEQISADVFTIPVLLNGPVGFFPVQGTVDLASAFSDDDSRAKLARHPRAQADRMEIVSHRLLPDGTQRFTLREDLRDGCRACDQIGLAITFLDIAPDANGEIRRRPASIYIGPVPEPTETTARTVRQDAITLQLLLNLGGFEAGPIDGYPGPATRTALMEYQAENCMTPTGQPDLATAELLVSREGYSERCAGASLPPGITANAPLVPGIYVRTPEQCGLQDLPYDIIFDDMRMIGEGTAADMAAFGSGIILASCNQ